MLNITYYLGAGASFNSVPLYSNFQERLNFFRDYIFYNGNKFEYNVDSEPLEYYISKLDEIIEMLDPEDYSSVDTLAHALFKQSYSGDRINFYQLKYLLNDFFMFEQMVKDKSHIHITTERDDEIVNKFKPYSKEICKRVNNSIDKRYRPFLLPQFVENENILPDNLNIVSWNYDIQLEMTYADTFGTSISNAQKKLQIYPSPSVSKISDSNQSSIIKLNGTAGIYYKGSKEGLANFIYDKDLNWSNEYLLEMIETFFRNRSRIHDKKPFFKFYFEEGDPVHTEAVKYANDILAKTDVLIIIGYSFHTSNRKIDEAVLKNAKNIRKVIIQTKDNDFESVKYNLLNTRPDLETYIEKYPTLDNFPTPNNIGILTGAYNIV